MYEVSFNPEQFLAEHWQQKAVVLKNALVNFVDPLSAEELAGLAMEPELQSRLVTNREQRWQAQQGPFEDFAALGESHSSLLVQGVDHWHSKVNQLAEAFQFIPNWRFDDVMISYSTPQGGVGPHIDQYCVFIVQGFGRRRWRVGEKQILKEFISSDKLKHCEDFEATIDVVLEPGDVLYIPPGCPHEGYALEAAMNYSIGFRAPNALELVSSFADYLLQNEPKTPRFSDAKRQVSKEFGRIAEHESQALNKMMVSLLSSPELSAHFLGQHLSESAHSSNIVALHGTPQQLGLSHLQELMEQGLALRRCAGIKALYLDVLPYQLFVDGHCYHVPNCSWALAKSMCDYNAIDSHSLRALKRDSHQFDWLLELLNCGYWYFEQPDL